MKKPKVVFAFTEAGMGHIMPMRSLLDSFEKKYGNVVECVNCSFFKESKSQPLIDFEKYMCDNVAKQNRHTAYGFMLTTCMDIAGRNFSSMVTMKWCVPHAYDEGVKHMRELEADMVISTHWATNYYAEHVTPKPLTVMYVPDAHVNPLFSYPCDLTMISMKTGYDSALKKYKKRFNEDNLKLVPFCIRKEAYTTSLDKKENRRKLGLDENKFTIVLVEGGYGIGKMKQICEIVLERDLLVNLIPICGKNQELFEYFKTLKVGNNTSFYPQGFSNNIFDIIAASDLFCGKSGNIISEPTFFGVPSIITKHTTNIETKIGNYYVDYVGCAINIFNPKKVVDKIEEFMDNPQLLEPYRQNAIKHHNNYGSEKAADYIFELLSKKFPEIKNCN